MDNSELVLKLVTLGLKIENMEEAKQLIENFRCGVWSEAVRSR